MTITDEPQAATATAAAKPKFDALLAKYVAERDKRLRADGNDQYLQVKGHLAHYLDDPYTPKAERAPKTDHVTFAFVGGGFAGLVTGARLVEAGITDRAHRREGRRLRRHLVLEPLSRRPVRHRLDGLHAAAGRDRPPAERENTPTPRKSWRSASAIGRQYGLYDNALFHTEVEDLSWDETRSVWVIKTNRGDEFTASFIGLGTGPLHVAKLPGNPRHRGLQGPFVPHQPLGDYDYTGGRSGHDLLRRLHARQTGRQARRHHRHRRHLGAGGAAPGPRSEGTLRLPAHPLVDRRARQPAARSGLVRRRRHPRLAEALAGELHRQPGHGPRRRGRPGAGRLDRPVAPHPAPASSTCRRASARRRA